ncbi:transporter [bacterium]|nr:transporter [bacterium]
MKKLAVLMLIAVIITAAVMPASAQVLWRSAKTMKQGSFIAMAQWYYMDFTKKYIDGEWKDNPSDQLNWGFQTMFGYAVTDRMEMMIHIPYYFKEMKSNSVDTDEQGIGDIWIKTRLSVLPWTPKKHGLTITTTLRLPTGSKIGDHKFCYCGDGSTDFALGGIFSTAWMYNFRGHLKLNYWFNQKNFNETDIGDELKLIVKLDRNFTKKIMGFCTYIYYKKWPNEDVPLGTEIADIEKSRNYLVLGGVYKPISGLFIRPKVAFSIGGEYLIDYEFNPTIDIWYVFTMK